MALVHDYTDNPPAPCPPIDRDKPVPFTLATPRPGDAARLAHMTTALLSRMDRPAQAG